MIAEVEQTPRQALSFVFLLEDQALAQRRQGLAGNDLLQQRPDRQHHHVGAALLQGRQGRQARRLDLRMRAQRLVGRHLPLGKEKDPPARGGKEVQVLVDAAPRGLIGGQDAERSPASLGAERFEQECGGGADQPGNLGTVTAGPLDKRADRGVDDFGGFVFHK